MLSDDEIAEELDRDVSVIWHLAAGRDEAIIGHGEKALLELLEERKAAGLHWHYGPAAAALGIGD